MGGRLSSRCDIAMYLKCGAKTLMMYGDNKGPEGLGFYAYG